MIIPVKVAAEVSTVAEVVLSYTLLLAVMPETVISFAVMSAVTELWLPVAART